MDRVNTAHSQNRNNNVGPSTSWSVLNLWPISYAPSRTKLINCCSQWGELTFGRISDGLANMGRVTHPTGIILVTFSQNGERNYGSSSFLPMQSNVVDRAFGIELCRTLVQHCPFWITLTNSRCVWSHSKLQSSFGADRNHLLFVGRCACRCGDTPVTADCALKIVLWNSASIFLSWHRILHKEKVNILKYPKYCYIYIAL